MFPLIMLGIGGFMVRQRKCHTRMKKEFFAQLAGETMLDGQPIERTIEEGLWQQLIYLYIYIFISFSAVVSHCF